MGREGREVVSDILRTFVSERLQITNVSLRSRSNRPTRELRRNRSVVLLSRCITVKNRTDVNT